MNRTQIGLMDALQSNMTAFNQAYYVSLVDSSNQYQSFTVDADSYQRMQVAQESITLSEGEWLFLWIETDQQNQVLNWGVFTCPYSVEFVSTIYQYSYQPQDFIELMRLIMGLRSVHLKSFLWALFSKPELAMKFMSVQASVKHHHAFPGGLLNHSLECARIVRNALLAITNYSRTELELAMVAALLHDIGKVQTHQMNGNLTQEGFSVPHDVYTLKMVTPEIEQLKYQDLQLGIGLEYLLTWKESKGFPRLSSANIINAADRTSTANDLQKTAFADKPDYFHFTGVINENRKQIFQRLN